MSLFHVCDYCGLPIEDAGRMVTLSANGMAQDTASQLDLPTVVTGYVGHYHATERDPCWWRMREQLVFLHDCQPALDVIDVASPQKIATLRRRHTRPA